MKKLLSPLLISIIFFAACSPRTLSSPTLVEQGGILPTLAATVTLRPIFTATALSTNTLEPPAPLPAITKTPTQTPEPSYCASLRDRYQSPEGYRSYCEAKFGFALDYPNTYTIQTHITYPDASNPSTGQLARIVIFFDEDMTNYLEVDTYYMPAGCTLESQVEQYWTYPYREITDQPYDIRIGGKPAIAILNRWHQDYSEVNLFFQHGSYFTNVKVKAISESGLETNWQMVSSIQVIGVEGHDNQIPEVLIKDSYRLIDPRLVPSP